MPSQNRKSAESLFREAFERLKKNVPEKLQKGSVVSQNNVAKEAGRDPSALRGERYPELIQEIQAYLQSQKEAKSSKKNDPKNKARKLEQRLTDCRAQRDRLVSICHSQQAIIEELEEQVADLKAGKLVEFKRHRH